MDPKPVRNALSRHTQVYICPKCGMDEALRDMARKPLPLNEWAMAISFSDPDEADESDCQDDDSNANTDLDN